MMESGDNSQDWPKINYDNIMFICNFYDEFPKIATPYMRMAQKLR